MGISANIEDLIGQNCMQWYEHVLCPRIKKNKLRNRLTWRRKENNKKKDRANLNKYTYRE